MTDSEKLSIIMEKVNSMEEMIFELKEGVTTEVIRIIAKECHDYRLNRNKDVNDA